MSRSRSDEGTTSSRRDVLRGAVGLMAVAALPIAAAPAAVAAQAAPGRKQGGNPMSTITTKDGTEIYYKDWGSGPPVVFSHGWPLSADAWEAQMFFLASNGYRCIAHDRRGHGRSSQPWNGNDMDTYADDLAQLFEALDLKGAVDDRPLDGRRRGRALHRTPRHEARREGGADGRGAADHGEDGGQSRRAADRGLRRLPHGLPRRPLAVLPRRRRAARSSASTAPAPRSRRASSTRGGCRA